MRILYVNHTARVSGAERSLLERIALARVKANVLLACPDGELSRRAWEMGIETVVLDPPDVGFSSGAHAIGGAVVGMVGAGLRVRRLARLRRVDVIHAGSARAGLLVACCLLSHPTRVVDVRDALPVRSKGTLVRGLLRLTADVIVFNSEFTRRAFGAVRPARASVLFPPVAIGPLLDLKLRSPHARRTPPMLGVLGQITPWKGQDDAIRILAAVREQVPDARLRIVGSVVFTGDSVGFDNEAYERNLVALAEGLGIADAVELSGETDDLPSALAALDVLLVPSWAEPFGRVVVEGMAAGLPVVATGVGGPAELVTDGVTGFLAPPRQPARWADTVIRLLTDQVLAAAIATRARDHVARIADDGLRREELFLLYSGTRRARTRSRDAARVTG